MSNQQIQKLSIKDLLESKSAKKYIIPIYQRNYAWGDAEITQLIDDIKDVADNGQNYYLGTLVVHERNDGKLEVIDGQQRLTTLFLIALYLRKKYLRKNSKYDISWLKQIPIEFESRKLSDQALQNLFCNTQVNDIQDENSSIYGGYNIIESDFNKKKYKIEKFSEFFFEKAILFEVKVPEDTDLNHYFEIMNTRGEQLEEHEILKSKMMSELQCSHDRIVFNTIWEACSNMNKYVQMGFGKEVRKKLFGNGWSTLKVEEFDGIKTAISSEKAKNEIKTIENIINSDNNGNNNASNQNYDVPERFGSIITFPNFLLHVLRRQAEKSVSLNDKVLIKNFNSTILSKKDEREKNVKEFTFNLLKCRYLYDKYVIKRDNNKWALQSLKCYKDNSNNKRSTNYVNTFVSENQSIIMLLSAFHTSLSTQNYKYWFDAVLHCIYKNDNLDGDKNDNLDGETYLKELENIANLFMAHRYLKESDEVEYDELIFNASDYDCNIKEVDLESILSYSKLKHNFVFNYVDYLLWKEADEALKTELKNKNFEFTFRSSIEHYYPQNPINGNRLKDDVVHSFGNLCLISHSKNSKLSNHMPEEKKGYYKDSFDSIKQHKMLNEGEWTEQKILDHERNMIELITKYIR